MKATPELTASLERLLADSYTLYLKTHNYHWNVTGPMFTTLHLLFEAQYLELATAVDEIAERIRTVGAPAPGTYSQFSRLSSVGDEEDLPEALDMVKRLADAHDVVARTAADVARAAGPADDLATADLATRRIDVHEKAAWMLRSILA